MKVKHPLCCDVGSRIRKIGRTFLLGISWRNWGSYLLLFGLSLTQVVFAAENQNLDLRQSKETACPAQNFRDFLFLYANSESIQRTFIKTPLKTQRLNLDAEPEPKPITKTLQYSQLTFPLLPLLAERNANLWSLRIDELSEKKAKATVFKKDTGYQVTYFFIKKYCWVLEAIENWSM
jgi:hypothetical protein